MLNHQTFMTSFPTCFYDARYSKASLVSWHKKTWSIHGCICKVSGRSYSYIIVTEDSTCQVDGCAYLWKGKCRTTNIMIGFVCRSRSSGFVRQLFNIDRGQFSIWHLFEEQSEFGSDLKSVSPIDDDVGSNDRAFQMTK